ncbi:quinone oxidoreductase family protein [Sphingomonas rubra]|uniref:NADPH:quinone reductase n=1 Tax=Sphingomonas rubra TaxID=634430 RepID=A0A1I5RF54_9SPHN|nr:quinone oxidoreductase [Sphingomonas rubra]SFP56941.1 NADPH:quinone reductase [Sphingomonas rubra]
MTDFRVTIDRTGGPDVMRNEPVDAAALIPGPGEVRVRQTAVGLNFIDTYQRSGLYPVALPSGLGAEAAGVVEAVGDGVTDLAVGRRVAYGTGPLGAYATVRLIPAEHLVPLPDDVGNEAAAAAMLKGMTACYLIEQCAEVRPGQTVLVHAAAGGMGSILVPWLAHRGAVVIAHAGTAEKAERAREAGAAHVLSCPMATLASEVRALTGGAGVEVVLDGVGAASWDASLASLAPTGLLVSYGNASGAVPPFTALDLMKAGSVFVTRPTLAHYGATAAQRRHLAERVFAMMAAGLPFPIGQRFSLHDAPAAHRAIEGRGTHGATVMTV